MGLTAPPRSDVDATTPDRSGRTRIVAIALPLVLLVAGAIGYGIGRSTAPSPSGSATAPTVPGANPATLAEPTAEQLRSVDIGFVTDMLDHHDQIVEVATFVSAHATSEMARSLAFSIIASQQYEKGLLESYLRAHGVSRPSGPDRQAMAWMGTPVPRESMPGYLPKADVIALYNLTGPDLDRRFLEMTITHHEGGVHMAEDAMARSDDPWLSDLASKMVVDQRVEIDDARAALGAAS